MTTQQCSPWHILVALMIAAVAMLASTTAVAQEELSDTQGTDVGLNLALDVHGSMGGPNGLVGLSLTGNFTEHIALSAGGGLGLTGNGFSLMPRWMIHLNGPDPTAMHMLSFGAGASLFNRDPFVGPASGFLDNPDPIVWLNAEAHYVYQDAGGTRIGGYVGVTQAIHNDLAFKVGRDALPYFGFFTGMAF